MDAVDVSMNIVIAAAKKQNALNVGKNGFNQKRNRRENGKNHR